MRPLEADERAIDALIFTVSPMRPAPRQGRRRAPAAVRVTRDRGRPLESELAFVAFATVHPSSILRAPDDESRRRERALFVGDLRIAAAGLR